MQRLATGVFVWLIVSMACTCALAAEDVAADKSAAETVPVAGASSEPVNPQAPVVVAASPGAAAARSYVEIFGEKKGEPVNQGFVFVDGKYVEAPYRVAREGIFITINGVRLSDRVRWPPVDYDDKKPELPKLTEESRLDDLAIVDCPGDSLDRRMVRWLKRHHTAKDAGKKIVAFYESLPFVKQVQTEGDLLRVTMKNGSLVFIDVGGPVYRPPSKDEVAQELEKIRERYETRLKKGDCFIFLGRQVELSFGRKKVASDLQAFVEILRSDRKPEEKLALLERMDIIRPGMERFCEGLLTKFESTKQLDERISGLAERSRITPRKIEDIPERSPSQLLEETLEQRTKASTAGTTRRGTSNLLE